MGNRLTWNRTRDDRLEGGSYIRLTMSPRMGVLYYCLGQLSTHGAQSLIGGASALHSSL